tara:strand:- start:752 stop:1003 length:252 start_codon:yes stop_codon:yes gene_type:complete
MPEMTMLWNGILTLALGGFLWWIRSTTMSINEVRKEMFEVREHIAVNYVSKEDLQNDLSGLYKRLDRMDAKLDQLMKVNYSVR